MSTEEFQKAYYIKLGRGGAWEESSIREAKARIGWIDVPLKDINTRNWAVILGKRRHLYRTKGAATMDINALKHFVESTSADVWITFHASRLWWCRLGEREVFEDRESRYRCLSEGWNDRDVSGNQLQVGRIPGSIAKVQRFAGTLCRVKEVDDLRRLINSQHSEEYEAISASKDALVREIERGLRRLHWKDFETLVDLLFRNAGWRRTSVLGENMKYADLELEEPITRERYQVQVKSAATLEDFLRYADGFSEAGFRKLYFVVHSPDEKLAEHQPAPDENVELVLPGRLAQMAVALGLTDWLLQKIR